MNQRRIEPNVSAATIARARELRKEAPGPERMLWRMLRDRRLDGLKFRRQQPIGPYFADFYCEAAKLVVELDGFSHDFQERHDQRRDEFMHARGVEVLRIANDHLLGNPADVAEVIWRTAESRIPSPQPSPRGRGGMRNPLPLGEGRVRDLSASTGPGPCPTSGGPSPQPSPDGRGG